MRVFTVEQVNERVFTASVSATCPETVTANVTFDSIVITWDSDLITFDST